MICGTCATENPAGTKFCGECGARLTATCATCGAALNPAAKFCGECGTPTSAAAMGVAPAAAAPGVTAAPQPVPVAERRLVSVLFADLVGFTPFAEERDAEEVRDTLSRYFELASDVIGRYGGSVEKFIGDAVMAVWGAPVAHEDDAERAVRAALELVDAVRQLGPAIQARAGILTGEAAVTIGATNQGMVAGDIVNTASRLQSVAPPGAVLVGEATQRAASAAIAFEEAGAQALKGKTAPVPAWLARRVVAERGGRNRAETLEAPFVGRESELRLLKDLFHATGREKRVRLVSVIGPAGTGKSRLAWEFSKYTDGLVETMYWHLGRCPAYGDGISFWALGEMVRRRCGLLESDDEPTTRVKVAETVRTWVPEEADRRWIEPALLALLGFESGIGSEQLFGAWRTFFERIAAKGTVVMMFEDLHHADAGLLDFIDHVLEWSKGSPIYIVTQARPDLLEKRPTWASARRHVTSIYLEPLPEGAMRELLTGLVPGLPESATRTIVGRADGIPLYAVETVRMLVTEGRIANEGGTYVPAGDLASVAIPDSLTALIASRLDTLDPADRALISDAAVLGQSFTLPGLSAVSGIPADELEPRLRGLVRREVLSLQADPRSPERGQYAFVQALIREVAYNTVSRKDRKARHLAAARFFESLDLDELAGGLAGHYLAAHHSASEGPEADALAGQARIALKAAAERASALGSYDQAVTFLTEALTVTSDPAEEADLLERAAAAASATAHKLEAEAFARRAVETHRSRGDRRGLARASAALGWTLLGANKSEPAVLVLEGAAAELADLGPDPGLVALNGQLARAYFLRDQAERAIETADRTLALAEQLDLVEIVADTLVTRGSALSDLGRRYEGLGVLLAGLRLADANDLPNTSLRARNNIGIYQMTMESPAAALATSRDGIAQARRLGLRSWLISLAQNGAESARSTGDWDWALSELEPILATELDPDDRFVLLGQQLVLRMWRGEDVAADFAWFSGHAPTVTEPTLQWYGADVTGWRALTEGRLTEARTAFLSGAASALNATSSYCASARPALWAGDAIGARADLDALLALSVRGPFVAAYRAAIEAGVAAINGSAAEALVLYRQARRGYRDLGLPWEAALTGIDMATLLDPADGEVRAAADFSREAFTRLGAVPFLARLDAALARQVPVHPAASAPAGGSAVRAATPATSP